MTNVSISEARDGRVFLDGKLGQLNEAVLVNENALEITGQYGTLIIEIGRHILQETLNSSKNDKSSKKGE